MQNNLIFLHLPKNGGNTLHSILDRIYEEDDCYTIKVFRNIFSDKFVDHLKIQDFKMLTQERRSKIRLLKGHMIFGLHNYLEGASKYITFLRSPEERIISYYYYVLRKPQHRLYHLIKNNDMSLFDFVSLDKFWDVNNAQIRLLSGIDDKEEFMLEKAIENIEKHFAFVGTQELFDESLILLKKIFNWRLPYYEEQNKTKNRIQFKSLDSKTQMIIRERNKGDSILHEKISKNIEFQIANNPSISTDIIYLRYINYVYTRSSFFRKVGNKLNTLYFK